jgi:heme/copper-type cytochrome/quinol oxidase subunit 2
VGTRQLKLGVLALGAAAVLLAPTPSADAWGSGERTVRVEATRSAFAPSVIRVRRGERVTLELVATDVVHGLYVDGYDVATTAEPGRPGRLTFVASRSGTFRLRCSVTCGPLHPFVAGALAVGPNALLWRAGLLAALVALGGIWLARR